MNIERPTSQIPPTRPAVLPQRPAAPADATRVAAPLPRNPLPGVPQKAAPTPIPGIVTDKVHLSLGNRTNGMPANTIRFSDASPNPALNPQEFGSAVHVENPRDPDERRLFGILSLTPNQQQQIRAAESRAFDRFFTAGNNPERGSLQAKLAQASLNTYMPGMLEHHQAMNVTNDERKLIMKSLQEYGEELGSIGITGRSRRELERYLEDKFFITLFDRDTEEFEDYFKNGAQNFFGDSFGNNSPDNNVVKPTTPAAGENLINLPNAPQEEKYKWKFFQPRVGVSLKGTNFKEAMIKPKIDLVRLRGPAETEVRLVADVAFNIAGKFEPKGEIYARKIINHTPGDYGGLTDNLWAESRTEYDYTEGQVRTSLGVRKQISPDSSMGLYALYSTSTKGAAPDDLGLGVNYQSRWN